jgi:hypothetical protein
VTLAEAERWVTNVEEFRMRLRGITPGAAGVMAMGGATAGDVQRFSV